MLYSIQRRCVKNTKELIEFYSIQADNLMNAIVHDFTQKLDIIKKECITFESIKSVKFLINNKYKRIIDLSDLQFNNQKNRFEILSYNIENIQILVSQITLLNLNYKINGQFILIENPSLDYNQLFSIVDDINKLKNSTLLLCSKAKLEPTLRARLALENDFIETKTANQTLKNCEIIYKKYQKIILEKTNNKIKKILGERNYKRYRFDNFSD